MSQSALCGVATMTKSGMLRFKECVIVYCVFLRLCNPILYRGGGGVPAISISTSAHIHNGAHTL